MSNVYFAADLHLGHSNVTRFRTQFESSAHHDSFITDSVLSTSTKRNTLWLLGDCFFTMQSLESLSAFKNAYSQVHLVIGNHDTEDERQEVFRKILIDKMCNQVHSLVKYKDMWLSHAPIHPEELRGKRNVHGHCHYYAISDKENYRCVSMEQIGYAPITLNDLWK